MSTQEKTIKYDDGMSAKISILHDEDGWSVWEDQDHAEMKTFEDRTSFWEAVDKAGMSKSDIDTLVEGGIVVVDDKIIVGLERYRHSGDVYALCSTGNFPDRQWDVSPIVGWITPHPDIDSDVISDYTKTFIDTGLRRRLNTDIESFNDMLSGNCWGYVIKLYDKDDRELDTEWQDSCWGFLGDSNYCLEAAVQEAAGIHDYYIRNYKPKNISLEKLYPILIEKGYLKGEELIGNAMPTPLQYTYHGECCNCRDCKYYHDECVCSHNELLEEIIAAAE